MLSRIRERKVVQWLVAYTVAAWAVLQALDLVSEALEWSTTPLRVAVILSLVGAPLVVVLGWYHGEKGRQRVTPAEAFILGALTLAGGITLVAFGAPAEDGTDVRPPIAADGLDSLRYVLLPFEVDASVRADPRADLRLHDALSRWSGIELVDRFQVRDALLTAPGSTADAPRTNDVREIARLFGAGRLIRGDLSSVGSGLRIHAAVFETGTGRTVADTALVVDSGEPLADSVFLAIGRALLFGHVGSAGADSASSIGTRSFPAYLAFLRGQEALERWDLDTADSLFSASVAADPEFTRADLWRAQVRNWSGVHPRDLLSLAERAASRPNRLAPRERVLAGALLGLSNGDYEAACHSYDELRRANDRDFAAWYGLGECRGRDEVVLPDRQSPTGWRYRSSYHRALDAYEHAFRLLPSVHRGFASRTFESVDKLFYLSTSALRAGYGATADTLVFLSRPIWMGDTLAFLPQPSSATTSLPGEVWYQRMWTAVEAQRTRFHRIAALWAEAFPESPDALQALALAQELLGDPSAIQTTRRARALATDPRDRLRMAAEEALLTLKFGDPGEYDRVVALGDSVLTAAEEVGVVADPRLRVTAALLGRVHRSAAMARQSAVPHHWRVHLPTAMTRTRDALLAYAAFGVLEDSVVAMTLELESALSNRVPAEQRAFARNLLFDRAASLAFTARPLPNMDETVATTGYRLLQAQGALLRNDTARAERLITEIEEGRRNLRPAELSIEAVFPESALRAAIGDTAGAVALLDSTLSAMRWLEPESLDDIPRAASMVRAMALRAELANAAGDSETATRWADAVVALWERGDSELQPLVRRCRAILRADHLPLERHSTSSSPEG